MNAATVIDDLHLEELGFKFLLRDCTSFIASHDLGVTVRCSCEKNFFSTMLHVSIGVEKSSHSFDHKAYRPAYAWKTMLTMQPLFKNILRANKIKNLLK